MTAVALAALFVMSSEVCRAQKAVEQISAESGHLRQLLTNAKLPADQLNGFMAQLDQIDKAAQTGSLLQAMYLLQRARVELMADEYVRSRSEVSKGDIAAFELEWKRLGRELSGKEKELTIRRTSQLPAAVTALAETSVTQVQPYYQSGLLYGRNTTIADGLYYLGLARANLDFALFCRQLNFERLRPAPKFLPIQTALESLEAAAIKAFQDPANAARQRRFIEINSTLKMARELNAERRYAGALKAYLDALTSFGLVSATVPDSEGIAKLKKRAQVLQVRLTAGRSDQSIGLTYLELALAAQSEGEFRRAAVIVEQVLPSYLKSQGETVQ